MADNTSKVQESKDSPATPDDNSAGQDSASVVRQKEIGGRDGPDPTRYGDWEKNGRCIDF
jgi:hypothetical protein